MWVVVVAFHVGSGGCFLCGWWRLLVHFGVVWRRLAQVTFNVARQKKWGKMYLAEI